MGVERCWGRFCAHLGSSTGTLGALLWSLGRPWGGSWVVPGVSRVGPRQSWGVRSGHFKAHWGRMGLNKGAPGRAGTDFGCI